MLLDVNLPGAEIFYTIILIGAYYCLKYIKGFNKWG